MVSKMLFDKSKSSCAESQSIVVSEEKGKKHRVNNTSRLPIYQYHIDGDIINDLNVQKCDYIVEVTKDKPVAFIIELKGSHLSEACNQIISTIERFKHKLNGYNVQPRIIIGKINTHAVNGSEYRRLRKAYPQTRLEVKKCTDTV